MIRRLIITTLVLAALGLAGAASAQEALTRRDTEAAGAIWAQRIAVETLIDHCKQYVAEKARQTLEPLWTGWQEVNRDYLDVADVIRSDMLKALAASRGSAAMARMTLEMAEKNEAARAEIRATIDENPAENRAGKCYGILVAITQGRFDIWEALPADAKHIEARVKVMDWLSR